MDGLREKYDFNCTFILKYIFSVDTLFTSVRFHILSSTDALFQFSVLKTGSGCGVMTQTGLQRDVIALTEVEEMMKETDNAGYEHTPLLSPKRISPISTMTPPSFLAGFPIWLLLLLCSWLLPPSTPPLFLQVLLQSPLPPQLEKWETGLCKGRLFTHW